MVTVTARSDFAPGAPGPRIGPNSVLQTLAALEALEGAKTRADVEQRLPPVGLDGLIPEAWFVDAVGMVRRLLPPDRSERVLAEAGTRTASYVARHRIPRPFAAVLRALPARWAVPLLLFAFEKHAWTFAGAGRFSFSSGASGARLRNLLPGSGPPDWALRLERAPTCRDGSKGLGFGGAFYAAAFEGLLQLAAPGLTVREVACARTGEAACRFVLEFPASGGAR